MFFEEGTAVRWTATADSGSFLKNFSISPPNSVFSRCEILWILSRNSSTTTWSCTFTTDQPKTITFTFELQDTDGDGLPDNWEVDRFGGTTIANSTTDYDNDDLLDIDEYKNNTDPKNSDSDNDGMTDGWEVANGLDPLDDIFTIIVNGMGTVTSTDSRINCRSNCQELYDEGTVVNWTATADSGWVLNGFDIYTPESSNVFSLCEKLWILNRPSGDPLPTTWSCTTSMQYPKIVTVNFSPKPIIDFGEF